MLRGINRSYLWMRGMCSQCNVPLCRAFCSGATLSPCCQAAGYQQLSLHHFQYFDNHWLQRGRISDDHSCFKLLMNGTVLTWCWRFMSFCSYSDQISFLGDCVQSLSGKTQFTRGLIQDGWREVGWLQWIPARDLTAAQDTLYIIIQHQADNHPNYFIWPSHMDIRNGWKQHPLINRVNAILIFLTTQE